MKNNYYISGLSLPIAVIFTIAGMGLVFSYYNTLYNEFWVIEYQIAEAKAGYMADTGIAESRAHMITSGFNIFCDAQVGQTYNDTSGTINSMEVTGEKMGEYYVKYCMDPETFAPRAESHGTAVVKNAYGKPLTIEKIRNITFSSGDALNDYLYLTNSEKAGGAPFVFDGNFPSEGNRREVNFSTGDAFNSLWPANQPVCEVGFQTNGTFVMSDFGCPTFRSTVTITKNDEGEFNYPDMGVCNENQVFQGNPPLDTLEVICLNSSADFQDKREYVETHPFSHLFLDATTKLNHTDTYFSRDTLIMTDLEFITENGGGVKVKQWWYLMPPYLSSTLEMPFVFSNAMNSPGDNCTQANLYQCNKYIESMENFHAKTVTNNGFDSFLNQIVQSTFGFHHYDIKDIHASSGNNWVTQLNDAHLLPDYQLDGYKVYYFNKPTAIYVKGGPVRVHGTFKGRYTVMTDEHITYHRHAWGSNLQASAGGPRIDTLWTNIWITDDLKNVDASFNGSLLSAQPNDDCNDGSENILGLVSGANVYIANTQANGARNNFWDQDIHIHAHIIAFNESFAVQYWQNTISNPAQYSDPPYGDAQGENIYNAGTGGNDYRGNIYLWGGVVQKYRGYVVRNNPGPYPTGPIGMDKIYNFDCNLKCTDPPPLYPDKRIGSCDEISLEKSYQIANYY